MPGRSVSYADVWSGSTPSSAFGGPLWVGTADVEVLFEGALCVDGGSLRAAPVVQAVTVRPMTTATIAKPARMRLVSMPTSASEPMLPGRLPFPIHFHTV